jgi:hypothetical protein
METHHTFIKNSFHYFCVKGFQVVNVPLIWINHINKILLLGSINYDNKFPLHIVTQTIMNWTWSLSCYNWIDLMKFFLTPGTYCWRVCEVVPCLVNLSFTFLVLVFKDDMLELLQRYHVGALNPKKVMNENGFTWSNSINLHGKKSFQQFLWG